MQSKKDEVKGYLTTHVNPLLKPMVEAISRERPSDIMKFILNYAQDQVNKRQMARENSLSEEEDADREGEAEFERKLKEKLQKKKQGGAKKMSRKGISAEVFGTYNQKSQFVPRRVSKKPHEMELLRKLLSGSIMFQGLSDENMLIVLEAIEEKKFSPSEWVIKEGEAGDVLFMVGSGEYACSKVIGGKPVHLKDYASGDLFGELSLMYNAKRAASVQCTKAGVLYALDRPTFIHIVQDSAVKKRQQHEKAISQIEILSQMKTSEKQQLIDTLREENYQPGDYVVKQGQSGDRLYFIVSGSLVAQKRGDSGSSEVVFKYKENEYFGEIALVKNTVRQASIKATSHCQLLSIGRQQFKRLLGPIEDILKRNMQKYKKFVSN